MFMQPQITKKLDWWKLETTEGTIFTQYSDFSKEQAEEGYDLLEPTEQVAGFGSRLSASGYLDCTEWCVYDTAGEAEEDLREVYCTCDSGEPCDLCRALDEPK